MILDLARIEVDDRFKKSKIYMIKIEPGTIASPFYPATISFLISDLSPDKVSDLTTPKGLALHLDGSL
jgi:hypothetical protein